MLVVLGSLGDCLYVFGMMFNCDDCLWLLLLCDWLLFVCSLIDCDCCWLWFNYVLV